MKKGELNIKSTKPTKKPNKTKYNCKECSKVQTLKIMAEITKDEKTKAIFNDIYNFFIDCQSQTKSI